jgi:hypothetical protein
MGVWRGRLIDGGAVSYLVQFLQPCELGREAAF